jgi:hypothetical protein
MYEHREYPMLNSRSAGKRRSRASIVLVTLLLAPMAESNNTSHAANADDRISEEEIRFESGDVTLHGTVLVPNGAPPGRKPALVGFARGYWRSHWCPCAAWTRRSRPREEDTEFVIHMEGLNQDMRTQAKDRKDTER